MGGRSSFKATEDQGEWHQDSGFSTAFLTKPSSAHGLRDAKRTKCFLLACASQTDPK